MRKRLTLRIPQGIKRTLFAMSLATLTPVATAETSDIRWNGFLNVVGGVLKNEPVTDFSSDKQYPSFQNYEGDLTFDPQTSAGLQAQKKLDEKTSVTMQLYSEGDVENYQANLKWLYLTYTPDLHSTFRIGRIGTPVYYFSDFLNVGYSYHWIQPPETVYPFDTTITGLDYVYESVWNDIEWSAEVLTGSGDEYLNVLQSRVITRNNVGLALSASTGNWLSFRVMFYRADTTFEMDVLEESVLTEAIETNIASFLAEQGLSPEQIAAALPAALESALPKIIDEDLDTADFPMNYGTIAVRAETERWLLMSEISTIQTDTYLFNDVITRYVTGGVRFGPVMYHVTVSDARTIAHNRAKQDADYRLPENPGADDYTDLLASRFKSMGAGSFARSLDLVSVGARVETSANTAVKFEVIHLDEQPIFAGDTYAVGENVLFRAALNAIF